MSTSKSKVEAALRNKINTDSDAIVAVERELRNVEKVTTNIVILGADAGDAPAKVWVEIKPMCPVSKWGGRLECKVNRKNGSVVSIDAGDYIPGDEYEED